MTTTFVCGTAGRRALVAAQEADSGSLVNAVDFLAVVDDAAGPPTLRQRVLFVRFFFEDGLSALTPDQIAISGGERMTGLVAQHVARLDLLAPAGVLPALSAAEQAWLAGRRDAVAAGDRARTLAVIVDRAGDYSLYTFALRASPQSAAPPNGFDHRLSNLSFSFKVDCPSPFDCEEVASCPAPAAQPPPIDYLARDFLSFRRLLLDRLAVLQPDDPSDAPVALRTTLVEVLAWAADRAAYHQDAVGTEAHLETARLRTSVRRHAHLLDYHMHEGCNARAFVHLPLSGDYSPTRGALKAGAAFLTRLPEGGPTIDDANLEFVRVHRPLVFEALEDSGALSPTHNAIALHTWGEDECCLPTGSTGATLVAEGLVLQPGDWLLLEQTRNPATERSEDADPSLRHIVRITEISAPYADALCGVDVCDVSWHREDALPFVLPLSSATATLAGARGNLVLVSHGETFEGASVTAEVFGAVGAVRAWLPDLGGLPRSGGSSGLTFEVPVVTNASAAATMQQAPRDAQPSLALSDGIHEWTPVTDLLSSAASARHVVVETESDGRVMLRFGDGVMGRRPEPGSMFLATVRLGTGVVGNVGTAAIAHLVAGRPEVPASLVAAVLEPIFNPLPAAGGIEPQTVDEVKRDAPRAFRYEKERAVTEADWAEVALGEPGVQRAAASIRWTGSWYTVFVYIDREATSDGEDDEFFKILAAQLERYRLSGYDIQVRAPIFVPLEIVLSVCVAPDHLPEVVERQLLDLFSSRALRDGRLGYFHPDNLTFGQSVYLSPIIAAAATVPGVRFVDATPPQTPSDPPHRFKRRWEPDNGSLAGGRIQINPLEIARCDGDPNAPENGNIRFLLRGGA